MPSSDIKIEIKGNEILDATASKMFAENAEKNFGQGYLFVKNLDTGVTAPVFSELRINEIIGDNRYRIENNKK